MVNSAPDFYDHPKVINGCSELFAQLWGPDLGVGVRSAVGLGPLPGNIASKSRRSLNSHRPEAEPAASSMSALNWFEITNADAVPSPPC